MTFAHLFQYRTLIHLILPLTTYSTLYPHGSIIPPCQLLITFYSIFQTIQYQGKGKGQIVGHQIVQTVNLWVNVTLTVLSGCFRIFFGDDAEFVLLGVLLVGFGLGGIGGMVWRVMEGKRG